MSPPLSPHWPWELAVWAVGRGETVKAACEGMMHVRSDPLHTETNSRLCGMQAARVTHGRPGLDMLDPCKAVRKPSAVHAPSNALISEVNAPSTVTLTAYEKHESNACQTRGRCPPCAAHLLDLAPTDEAPVLLDAPAERDLLALLRAHRRRQLQLRQVALHLQMERSEKFSDKDLTEAAVKHTDSADATWSLSPMYGRQPRRDKRDRQGNFTKVIWGDQRLCCADSDMLSCLL